jgi:glycosyltransferase involved in cell wall biosynthesis
MNILQVFNRYLHPGGEEKSVERIFEHLNIGHHVNRCLFDSAEWTASGVGGTLRQARLLFGNPASEAQFRRSIETHQPKVALFHNIYPVGSPILYRRAQEARLPVIQYLHNFRPFSVSGTLYANGEILEQSLKGNFFPEIRHGAWQGSIVKSAFFALMLKRLHRSGWLGSVRKWIAISDFMRDKLVESGIPSGSIVTLRHCWDAMPVPPRHEDDGTYLFLGRLVEEKGLLTLLAAWEALSLELGSATPKLIVAGEGPLRNRLEQCAHPNIRFAGYVNGDEKTVLLNRCRAVVIPSVWWEPLGLVTYEAYDHAKPVLAARSGGLCETTFHGRTGFLHQPGNSAELCRQVMAMQSMTFDERRQLGHNGRRWLVEENDGRRWRRSFDAILGEVAASTEPCRPARARHIPL